MEYEINRQYPIDEYDNICQWWQEHTEYDVDRYEDHCIIVPRTSELIIEDLRIRREYECFRVINRGAPWYDSLTAEQRAELREWYQAWLDVTETMQAPAMLEWIK